jgi:hypothetical protein
MELQTILDKIILGVYITEEEEIYYLVNALEISKKEAEKIVYRPKPVIGKLID